MAEGEEQKCCENDLTEGDFEVEDDALDCDLSDMTGDDVGDVVEVEEVDSHSHGVGGAADTRQVLKQRAFVCIESDLFRESDWLLSSEGCRLGREVASREREREVVSRERERGRFEREREVVSRERERERGC